MNSTSHPSGRTEWSISRGAAYAVWGVASGWAIARALDGAGWSLSVSQSSWPLVWAGLVALVAGLAGGFVLVPSGQRAHEQRSLLTLIGGTAAAGAYCVAWLQFSHVACDSVPAGQLASCQDATNLFAPVIICAILGGLLIFAGLTLAIRLLESWSARDSQSRKRPALH